jgi:alanine racemase
MKKPYRCWAEIELDALRANLAWVRRKAGPGVKVLTVVKADAYGHGLRQIAALLMQSGTDIFGVANLKEAQAVRSVGEGWPILMLGACLPAEIDYAVKDGVMPTLSTLEDAELFSDAAQRLGRTLTVHVKVDTGMGRLGVAPENAVGMVRQILALPSIALGGVFTHYAAAEDDARYSSWQRRRFSTVLQALRSAGVTVPFVHANSSAGLLHETNSVFNLVRPGLLVYGIVPRGRRRIDRETLTAVRPALSLKCHVSLVKDVPAGSRLSYGGTYTCPRRMRVATLTAGYGDGYPRAASNRARVIVGGVRCAVLGRVTMDQTLVDVSRVPHVQPGDEAVLIGGQGKASVSVDELAAWCGTIPWEVLTGISYRVPRLYRGTEAA